MNGIRAFAQIGVEVALCSNHPRGSDRKSSYCCGMLDHLLPAKDCRVMNHRAAKMTLLNIHKMPFADSTTKLAIWRPK